MDIFDRPSLRERKKIGEVNLSSITSILRRRWVKPLNGKGHYVPVLKVKLRDGREVWVSGKYHVDHSNPRFTPDSGRR